jgi:EAL domain-containing protein (putative c-di-GMP-specific phosphodiesterase class I)
LIKAINAFSKKLNATVIAEGIETEEELCTLREIGINLGQGFLFARPGPAFPDIRR